jgi:hypothetical protein
MKEAEFEAQAPYSPAATLASGFQMLLRVELRPALIEIAELRRYENKAKPGSAINDSLQRQTLKLSSARCPSAMAS